MRRLSGLIRYDREFIDSLSTVKRQLAESAPLPVIINGLSSGASVHYVCETLKTTKDLSSSPALILVSSDGERERLLALLSDEGIKALGYKSRDFVFHNISSSHDTERERISVLTKIINSECDAIIATPSAALSYTIPKKELRELSVSLSVGREISPAALREKLLTLGFAEVDVVDGAGQFSHRGGILDVWHSADSEPVRIEFFGDEIDRMVFFDPITQRSTDRCESLSLAPANETLLSSEARERMLKTVNKLLASVTSEEIKAKLKAEKTALEENLPINFRDKYFALAYGVCENLFTYLSEGGPIPIFVLDTNGAREEAEKKINALSEQRDALISHGLLTPSAARYTDDLAAYNAHLSKNATIHVNSFSSGLGNMRASGLFGFRCRRTVSYGDNANMLLEDIREFRKGLYRIVIVAENKQGADSLIDTLADADIAAAPIYDKPNFDFDALRPGQIAVDIGRVEGYELMTPKIALLSMARDEGRAIVRNRKRQRLLKKIGGAGERLMSYADLSLGDYVVHANYGIGLFEGIETIKVDGAAKDYITIRYAGTDKLFVPCDRLELIGKYIGERDKDGKVKLSKMGGTEWARTKSKAKSAARDIAHNLIQLYAERQRLPGFAFPADSELEEEFAADFAYEETDSQLVAIEEIKRDMMRAVPMNRLLCGDVGFGKTEVALRAAFKAIMGGKQVAILVPTTILAMQHYETAMARMRNYPVTVEMLSRFRTPKQQKRILEDTARGKVDLLIGTHKILSKKIEFSDLGLLIIDEEQRFGVAQKEKLKDFAKNVDVLTLSATPIPRTLNMAMNGISDMSILDEAPGERRPVQTYVLEHDDGVIRDAVIKEISRGGQVLYLYNKIEDIEYVAARLMRDIPEARVEVAHGRMEKDDIEDIWQALVRGDIDVLVCTTIIETGIDLPNANTLIIENADRMGLSQLHQIRGRVGRSARQAYAYFTYRAGKALSEIATKRLAAIREFAEFGAGFKVALRDLEIRGAGNLLGAEQHGYIDSVGYDLYVKLLNEAVLEERGEYKPKATDATVDIKVDAHIPEYYISTSAQRMEIYKKISLISGVEDLDDIFDEIIDRFGDPPKEVSRLVRISLIRVLASRCKITKVTYDKGALSFIISEVKLGVWSELFDKYKGLSLRHGANPYVTINVKTVDEAVITATDILTEYERIASSEEKNEEE